MATNRFTYTRKQLEQLFKWIYAGNINPRQLPLDLYQATLGYLSDGVARGFGSGDLGDEEIGLLYDFEVNLGVFSAAKTHQQVVDMTLAIFDTESRTKRSFSEFKANAGEIFEQYNVNWLKTEYRTVFNQSLAARQWMDFQRDKDLFPLLKYNTIGDERVREVHVELDGIVRHIDDPFWRRYFPPNDWGCRCDVTSHEDGEVTITPDSVIRSLSAPGELFDMNPAVDRVVFDESHPYISNVAERHHVLRDRNFDMPLPSKPKK